MNCGDKFLELFGHEPEWVSFCPYRISPLGAHVDHQGGRINGMAIDMGIHLAYSPNDSCAVELASVNFDGKIRFLGAEIGERKEGDWADHCRGAMKMLAEKYVIRRGLRGVLEGDFSIGGLSSSAAVIIVFMKALAHLNGITIGDRELIETARAAENRYVGVACGKLDQSCEVLSKKNNVLFMDCYDDSYELIPEAENAVPYEIAIFFSGLERSLVSSAYNLRLDECKAAAYSLLEFAGLERKSISETMLRDVPREVFMRYRDRLPEVFAKRAEHFFNEDERACLGAEAWRRGDIEEYGRLIFESGKSCIELYECGCPELTGLYRIMEKTKGIYGGCFSGAGFKGSCMAFIDPARKDEIIRFVGDEYKKAFPAVAENFRAAVCRSSDGVSA